MVTGILFRQVLMKVQIFFWVVVVAVVLYIPAPKSKTGFTVVLDILILVVKVRFVELQMIFS
jgi:hypothetical protein